jgi:SAM-dependent methyltransferase
MIEDKKYHWEKEYQKEVKYISKNNNNNWPWDIKTHDKNLENILLEYSITKGKIIEIGCGTGNDINFLCSKGFDVLGMDISETAIDISEKNNQHHKNVKFIVGDIDTDLPDEKFDIIYDRGCLHGNPELISSIFPKFYSILNNKGKIIIISSNSNSKDNNYATPPKLNIKNLIHYSDEGFKVLLIKEVVFQLADGYEDVLGYSILLERK